MNLNWKIIFEAVGFSAVLIVLYAIFNLVGEMLS